MPTGPLVSVLIPTHNRLPYLREAVDSVLRQTYENWELIIVDDGSTDNTREWILTLADPRIRLIAMPHSGNLGRVRNRGIAEARGELIAFLDSDDAFEPRKLGAQVDALATHPECGWSYTALTRVDSAGRVIIDPRIRSWRELSGWILVQLLRFDALVDTPTVMVRRELLERVGTLDEDLLESQDYELFFRFAAASPAIALSEPLTRKRVHPGSLSSDRMKVHEAWVVIYERWQRRSTDRHVRSTCAREARHHRICAARWRAGCGDAGRALAHLLAVLQRRPWSYRAWRALLWVVARSLEVAGQRALHPTGGRTDGSPTGSGLTAGPSIDRSDGASQARS
jgi:glycosyltransferase involved in cell wall biosynthesis